MRNVIRHGILVILSSPALFACHRDVAADSPSRTTNTEPGRATVTGASVVQNEMAVYRIADARCTRELACNNIGAGEPYSSLDACVQNLRVEMKDALDAD